MSEPKTHSREDIVPIELIEEYRTKRSPLKIVAQRGGQENMLSKNVDILIGGGSRGGGKSASLLFEALYDINNPFFNALILRNEKDDLLDLIDQSTNFYGQFGIYNKSQSDMTWNFNNGGKLKFSYYNDSYEDFKKRFQGKQYCYIGIDEITHCPYKKFKYLVTNNRNSHGIRNRFWGTCNPDPDSWVRKLIDWWIGEDGYAIPERDGVIRYCFMDGDSPDSIYWGSSPEEVYQQCKEIIDPLWKDSYSEMGYTKETMFIKSVTFVRADVSDNKVLLLSSPEYLANLAQQDEEQRMRDLEANWNWKSAGDDLIKFADLERMFSNSIQTSADDVNCASCDIAFTGGDNLVMWNWKGWHIKDLFVCRLDSKATIGVVREKLSEWGVLEKNFTYDLNGLGQAFAGFFPDALPFNNMAAPIPTSSAENKSVKYLYKDLKSECAYLFYKKIKETGISIEKDLLDRKFSGVGFSKTPLRQILHKERKCIRGKENSSDRGFCLIDKATMKKYVGHSPDFFESLIYRMYLDIKSKRHKTPKNLWMI